MTKRKRNVKEGDTFGAYKVLYEIPGLQARKAKCVCTNCGKESEVFFSQLFADKPTKLCKHCRLDHSANSTELKDKYGMLTPKKVFYKKYAGRNRKFVECVCDCGNTVYPLLGSLKQGLTKSCGCLRFKATQNKYNSVVEGEECEDCGVFFIEANGVKSLCKTCYNGYLRLNKKPPYPLSLKEEL